MNKIGNSSITNADNIKLAKEEQKLEAKLYMFYFGKNAKNAQGEIIHTFPNNFKGSGDRAKKQYHEIKGSRRPQYVYVTTETGKGKDRKTSRRPVGLNRTLTRHPMYGVRRSNSGYTGNINPKSIEGSKERAIMLREKRRRNKHQKMQRRMNTRRC